MKNKSKGWVPSKTIRSGIEKNFLRFIEDEVNRLLNKEDVKLNPYQEWKTINELKDIQMESWMGNQDTPIESRNAELWNQIRQGIGVCLKIDTEFIKELSDDELETIARELQNGLTEIQTYEPLRRDLDLLSAISVEYIRRIEEKEFEREKKEKELLISQTAVSDFITHFHQETGIAIPNKYFESFFKDK